MWERLILFKKRDYRALVIVVMWNWLDIDGEEIFVGDSESVYVWEDMEDVGMGESWWLEGY